MSGGRIQALQRNPGYQAATSQGVSGIDRTMLNALKAGDITAVTTALHLGASAKLGITLMFKIQKLFDPKVSVSLILLLKAHLDGAVSKANPLYESSSESESDSAGGSDAYADSESETESEDEEFGFGDDASIVSSRAELDAQSQKSTGLGIGLGGPSAPAVDMATKAQEARELTAATAAVASLVKRSSISALRAKPPSKAKDTPPSNPFGMNRLRKTDRDWNPLPTANSGPRPNPAAAWSMISAAAPPPVARDQNVEPLRLSRTSRVPSTTPGTAHVPWTPGTYDLGSTSAERLTSGPPTLEERFATAAHPLQVVRRRSSSRPALPPAGPGAGPVVPKRPTLSADAAVYFKQLQDYYAKHDPNGLTTLDDIISAAEISAATHHSISWLNRPLRKKYGESIEDFLASQNQDPAVTDSLITYGDAELMVHTIEIKKAPGRKLGLGLSAASEGYILVHRVNDAGLVFEQQPDFANVGRLITAVDGVSTARLTKAQTIDLLGQGSAVVKISLSDIPSGIESEVQQGLLSRREASVRQVKAVAAGALSPGDLPAASGVTRFRQASALVKSRRQYSHVSLKSADELYVRIPGARPSSPKIVPTRSRPGSLQFQHLGSSSLPGQMSSPQRISSIDGTSDEGGQAPELAIRGAAAVKTSKEALFDIEVDRSTLKLKKIIGSGQFGDVWGAELGKSRKVAVKALKKDKADDSTAINDFLHEAVVLMNMQHPNVIKLLAVVTLSSPMYVVIELMDRGSLLSYVQKDKGKRLQGPEIVYILSQVATGMAYLEQEDFIHRDVAARNILLDSAGNCKVGDLGQAVYVGDKAGVYVAPKHEIFAIRWLAPEAHRTRCFTIKSDVWSFGILAYEAATYGNKALYQGFKNAEVYTELNKGYRLPRPSTCPLILYEIMLACWSINDALRPSFETLTFRLTEVYKLMTWNATKKEEEQL